MHDAYPVKTLQECHKNSDPRGLGALEFSHLNYIVNIRFLSILAYRAPSPSALKMPV